MGFVLLITGLLMVITGARGTYAQFGSQVASEFTGWPNSFLPWLVSIGAIGAVGYIQALQTLSRWLMALIVLSIFLSNKGFFAQFQSALASGPRAPNAVPASGAPPGATTGNVLTGPGLTGQSTDTGQNTTSSPFDIGNWSNWLSKTLPSIFGGAK